MRKSITARRLAGCIVYLLAATMLAACGGKYYEVREAGSGKTYYTRDIDHDDNRVRFTDAATGDKVRLENSEVRLITKQQYRNAVGKEP